MRYRELVSTAFKAGAIGAVVLLSMTATSEGAVADTRSDVRGTNASDDGSRPVRILTPFDHSISLEDATSIRSVRGREVAGYSISSASIVGDFWLGSTMSVEEYLESIEKTVGTQPEVVGAYTVVTQEESSRLLSERGAEAPLVTGLPEFRAPLGRALQATSLEKASEISMAAADAAPDTWAPDFANIQIYDLTTTTVQIVESYGWFQTDPYNSPNVMADHWGMEFQLDFYTAPRAWPPGTPSFPNKDQRPNCAGDDYKDWASVSNEPFDWYALVYVDEGTLFTPTNLGLYGDYNDLFDECTRSSVTVGMANPQVFPCGVNCYQNMDLYLFPDRGQDDASTTGGLIQVVDRYMCEQATTMPLTDCMGATQYWGDYPGPGEPSRALLNPDRGWQAPDLCWMTENFGNWDPFRFSC